MWLAPEGGIENANLKFLASSWIFIRISLILTLFLQIERTPINWDSAWFIMGLANSDCSHHHNSWLQYIVILRLPYMVIQSGVHHSSWISRTCIVEPGCSFTSPDNTNQSLSFTPSPTSQPVAHRYATSEWNPTWPHGIEHPPFMRPNFCLELQADNVYSLCKE